MRKMSLWIVLLVFGLAGCATTKTENKDTQIQQLKIQIEDLKSELNQKNEEVSGLEEDLQNAQAETASSSKMKGAKGMRQDAGRMSPKRVQTALKNAGFYKGAVDGKIGRGTKRAIREFQKSNGLKADGVIGKETSLKLQEYLK